MGRKTASSNAMALPNGPIPAMALDQTEIVQSQLSWTELKVVTETFEAVLAGLCVAIGDSAGHNTQKVTNIAPTG